MLYIGRSNAFQASRAAKVLPESVYEDETTESHHAMLSAWRRWQARIVTKSGIERRHHTLVVAAIWTMLYLRDANSIDQFGALPRITLENADPGHCEMQHRSCQRTPSTWKAKKACSNKRKRKDPDGVSVGIFPQCHAARSGCADLDGV